MYFLTTEKALHTFTLPTKFRGGYAALNQAGKIFQKKKKKEWKKKKKKEECKKCLVQKICTKSKHHFLWSSVSP